LPPLPGKGWGLEGKPARGEKGAGMARGDLGNGGVLQAVPLRGGVGGRPVAERRRSRREELYGHARPVHVLDAARGVEGMWREIPVEGRAEVELAARGRIALEPWPPVPGKAGREVRP